MRSLWLSLVALGALLGASGSDYLAAKRKLDLIAAGKASSSVSLGAPELNAFVRQEVKTVAPAGVRDPYLRLGNGTATGFAYVDFPKLRQAQGKPMNWFFARLFAGERSVRVDTAIRSGDGKATVDVQRVEVGGVPLSGAPLDFVIHNFLMAYYPEAKIGTPFELAHGIDRLEVKPSEVRVIFGK